MITVYPRDGGEPRQASFGSSFTEDELKSSNIRYLFPDGCAAPKAEVDHEAVKAALEDMKILKDKLSAQNAAKAANGGTTSSSSTDGSNGSQRNPKLINQRGSFDLSQDVLNSQNGALTGGSTGKSGELNVGLGGGLNSGITGQLNGQLKGGANGGVNKGLTGEVSAYGFATQSGGPNGGTANGLKVGIGNFAQLPGSKGGLTSFAGIGTNSKQGSTSASSSATFGSNEAAGARGQLTGGFPGSKTGVLNTYLPANEGSIGNLKSVNGISSNTCCDENRTQILLSQGSTGSCGQGISKIVIPVVSEKLAKISMAELLEVTGETNNVEMLRKLLKLVEKYNL